MRPGWLHIERRRAVLAVSVSAIIHGLLLGSALLGARPTRAASARVSFEVVSRRPEAPRPVPAPPVPPALPPTVLPRTEAVRPPGGRPDSRARRPRAAPARPAFGVSARSVQEGETSFAVPVGDTVAIDPAPPQSRPAVAADGPPASPPATAPAPRVVAPPRLLAEHKVPYPERARDLGVEGTVELRVLVEADGRVTQARVLSGPGFGLDEAARRALLEFRFVPARRSDGRPVAQWITYRYTFRIED